MKRALLLLILSLCINADAQWNYVSTAPTSEITCISVVNPDLIWVCGTSRTVYRSTNGGVNWVSRGSSLTNQDINSISALDTSNCWIGTAAGNIYRTTNGGSNWELQFALSGSFSNGIKMFDQNNGWYYGDPAGTGQPHQWRITTNGGANWELSPDAPLANANEYGLLNAWDWVGSKVWISTGTFTAGTTSARMFRSASGFSGWSPVTMTGTGNSQGLYFSAIAFVDSLRGLSACNGSGDCIRRTTDGGLTWTTLPNPPGISNFIPFNMCGLKDGSNTIFGLFYTTSNKCFKTTDLGETWIAEQLPSQAAGSLRLSVFLSPTLGYATGSGGVFLRYGNSIGITPINNEIPSGYELKQNYPNPFNPSTVINFSIPSASDVSIKVFDALGREVRTLLDEYKAAGNYAVEFNASSDLHSGIYYYTITAGNFVKTNKMMLIK